MSKPMDRLKSDHILKMSTFDNDIDDLLSVTPYKSEELNTKENPLHVVEEDKGYSSSSRLNDTKAESLEGDEDLINIGKPIFESSVCLGNTFDDWSKDTTFEATPPLDVKVKSKVVVPRRSNLLNNTMEAEDSKTQYMFSVTAHMKEKQTASSGAMNELLELMTHVAGQTDGTQWQHPSDLTCRNYQRRFMNGTPSMTLSQWQEKNFRHLKRFSKVSKIHFPSI